MDKKFIATFRNEVGLEYSVLLDHQSQVIGAIRGASECGSFLLSVVLLSSDIIEDIKRS